MAVSYSSNRVTINGSFKSGTTTGVGTSTTITITSDQIVSGDIGRLLAVVPSGTNSDETQVRRITAVSGTTVTVHDAWVGGAVGSSINWRVAHNCQDVHNIGDVALQKIGDSTFRWNADWDVVSNGFFGDLDISLEMEKNSSGTLWQIDAGGIVQFGLLWGGENNGAVETTNGCNIFFNKKVSGTNSFYIDTNTRVANGAVINYYGSLIQSQNPSSGNWSFQRMTGPTRFIGCSFDGPMGGRFYHEASEWVSCRMSGNDNTTPAWSLGATFLRDIDGIIFYQNGTVLKNYLSFTGVLRNTVFTSSNGLIFSDSGTGIIDFVDCTTVVADSPDQYQFKSVNYVTTDADGVALSDVLIRINDNLDATQTAVRTTDGSGVASEILANFRRGTTSLAPFRIRIRKFGFFWSSLASAITDPIRQSVALLVDPNVTQTSGTAQAHTGISIVDHGASPVSWNGKNWGITITGNLTTNSSLTVDDIKHYLHYVLAQDASIGGKSSGLLWHNLIPMSSLETERGSYGATNKGVRVIDQAGNPFPGLTRMQSDDATYYIPPVIVPVTITCVDTSGSPIQNARVFLETAVDGVLYNDLTDVNGEITLNYTYTVGRSFINSKARKSSSPPYYKSTSISGTITSSGFSATVTMLDDE